MPVPSYSISRARKKADECLVLRIPAPALFLLSPREQGSGPVAALPVPARGPAAAGLVAAAAPQTHWSWIALRAGRRPAMKSGHQHGQLHINGACLSSGLLIFCSCFALTPDGKGKAFLYGTPDFCAIAPVHTPRGMQADPVGLEQPCPGHSKLPSRPTGQRDPGDGAGSCSQAAVLLLQPRARGRAGPGRRAARAPHPSARGSSPAAARNKSEGRKSDSRRKGMEHFMAVCAALASVFVSRFLCDWRFLYTKIDGFPIRLP